MSFTYLTQDTMVICTFQTDPTPKKLIPTPTIGKAVSDKQFSFPNIK